MWLRHKCLLVLIRAMQSVHCSRFQNMHCGRSQNSAQVECIKLSSARNCARVHLDSPPTNALTATGCTERFDTGQTPCAQINDWKQNRITWQRYNYGAVYMSDTQLIICNTYVK